MKNKNDARYRLEINFIDGEAFLVNNDYSLICDWLKIIQTPMDDQFTESVVSAVIYDNNVVIDCWDNPIKMVA